MKQVVLMWLTRSCLDFQIDKITSNHFLKDLICNSSKVRNQVRWYPG